MLSNSKASYQAPKPLPKYVSPAASLKRVGDRLLELKPLLDNAYKENNSEDVRTALQTLKNYQLNVVVDLKNIMCDVNEGSGQCLQMVSSEEVTQKREESQGRGRKNLERSFERTQT